jgi:hypothetical protein
MDLVFDFDHSRSSPAPPRPLFSNHSGRPIAVKSLCGSRANVHLPSDDAISRFSERITGNRRYDISRYRLFWLVFAVAYRVQSKMNAGDPKAVDLRN